MRDFEPFKLKDVFFGPDAARASVNLSPSFCEPMTLSELLALDPDAAVGLEGLSLGYPPPSGGAPLRDAIATQYDTVDADRITAFHGTDEALFAVLQALLEPGDTVVCQMPVYQSLYSVPRAIGCTVRPWMAREEAGWACDLDALPALLEGARLLILNQPQSPTGHLMTRAEFERVLHMAAERGVFVLCDEIYRGVELPHAERLPPACDVIAGAASMAGLSKTLGCPGLRVGWIATRDDALRARLAHMRNYLGTFVAGPSDLLGTIAARHHAGLWRRNADLAAGNLALWDAFLARHPEHLSWQRPSCGGVAFVRVHDPAGADAFSRRLLETAGILVAPAGAFDFGDAHIRVGLGTRTIAGALDRLEAVLTGATAPAQRATG